MICLNCTFDMCESCVNNEKWNNPPTHTGSQPKSPCSHVHYYSKWGSVAEIEKARPDLNWNSDYGVWEGSAEALRSFFNMLVAAHSSTSSPYNDSH